MSSCLFSVYRLNISSLLYLKTFEIESWVISPQIMLIFFFYFYKTEALLRLKMKPCTNFVLHC